MKYTYYVLSAFKIALFFLIWSNLCYSQSQNFQIASLTKKNNFERIYVGDQLPFSELIFTHTRNTATSPLKWSDLKDKKLIIIDFWSKYCSVCIGSMPRMEELQQKFPELQILLVTYNSEKELKSLFEKSPILKSVKLPMIFSDSVFTSMLFPHNTEPYHVWIASDGKVIGTVGHTETTEKNIEQFLSGQMPNLAIREDIVINEEYKGIKDDSVSFLTIKDGGFFNKIIYYSQIPDPIIPNKPFRLSARNIQTQTGNSFSIQKQYSIFFKGIPEYNSVFSSHHGYLTDNLGSIRGFKLFNLHINQIIATAYPELTKPTINQPAVFKSKYLVDQGAKTFYEEITDTTNAKRHHVNNLYSYESFLMNFTKTRAINILKEDIARCFGIRAKVENRMVPCVKIRIIDSILLNKTCSKKNYSDEEYQNGEIIRKSNTIEYVNINWNALPTMFISENKEQTAPFVIDETDIPPYNIISSLTLHTNSHKLQGKNIDQLKSDLATIGITLTVENQRADVIVLYPAF